MRTRGISHTRLRELEKDYAEYGEYRIVTTVRHTGTHSIMEQFPEYKHWHCNAKCLEIIENNPCKVITTYRDPLSTAQSWQRRGQLPNGDGTSPARQGMVYSWKEAWYFYGKILKLIPEENIYPINDLNHHLYKGPKGKADIDQYLIDYANDQIKGFNL